MSLERLHSLLVDASNALDDIEDDAWADGTLDDIAIAVDKALRLVQDAMEPKERR